MSSEEKCVEMAIISNRNSRKHDAYKNIVDLIEAHRANDRFGATVSPSAFADALEQILMLTTGI